MARTNFRPKITIFLMQKRIFTIKNNLKYTLDCISPSFTLNPVTSDHIARFVSHCFLLAFLCRYARSCTPRPPSTFQVSRFRVASLGLWLPGDKCYGIQQEGNRSSICLVVAWNSKLSLFHLLSGGHWILPEFNHHQWVTNPSGIQPPPVHE